MNLFHDLISYYGRWGLISRLLGFDLSLFDRCYCNHRHHSHHCHRHRYHRHYFSYFHQIYGLVWSFHKIPCLNYQYRIMSPFVEEQQPQGQELQEPWELQSVVLVL